MRACLLISCLAVFGLAVFASAEKWSFVVAGDGRADGKGGRAEDKNGVNVVITKEIADAVLTEKSKFLLWTGDLVLGYAKNPSVFETQLLEWRGIMQPLYDKKIPVLACRGNHDASSTDADNVWNKVFSGKYALPSNGPVGEKNLSFYYSSKDVLAVAVDQYAGTHPSINQTWLDGVLTTNKKRFIFAYGHEPAFMDGAHKDTMDAAPVNRDAFWESMIKAGARAFFCGHDHLYDHMAVTRANGTGPELHQFVAGTAGAPFYEEGDYIGKNTYWSLRRVKNIVKTYGYLLVEIDGHKCTITFKGRVAPGKYQAMDRWSYSN